MDTVMRVNAGVEVAMLVVLQSGMHDAAQERHPLIQRMGATPGCLKHLQRHGGGPRRHQLQIVLLKQKEAGAVQHAAVCRHRGQQAQCLFEPSPQHGRAKGRGCRGLLHDAAAALQRCRHALVPQRPQRLLQHSDVFDSEVDPEGREGGLEVPRRTPVPPPARPAARPGSLVNHSPRA